MVAPDHAPKATKALDDAVRVAWFGLHRPSKRRGPKFKFSRTRDAAAVFMAVREEIGYRRGLREVSALFAVPERNIERELDPATTVLPPKEYLTFVALCGIAANSRLIRTNIADRVIDGLIGWPEPYRKALEQLIPGTRGGWKK